jgi:cytochrome c553
MALPLGLVALGAQGTESDVEARLNQVMGNAQARATAAQAGKRAAFFCENCHGATGNSPLEHVPNLAGQNATYLLTQIDKFGDGRRKDDFMSGLVKVLKPEDRFNIAVFYATQAVEPMAAKDARQVQAGRDHYMRACRGCHGPEARGTREVARLAGQRSVYLVNALKDYRAAKGMRADPRMTSVAKSLSDGQIQALASYLSSLK